MRNPNESDTVAELEQLNRAFYAWLNESDKGSGYQLLINKLQRGQFVPGDLRHAMWQAWRAGSRLSREGAAAAASSPPSAAAPDDQAPRSHPAPSVIGAAGALASNYKTADWYMPHHYRFEQAGNAWWVMEYNGAGQKLRAPGLFDTFEQAENWVEQEKFARAKSMGAIVEES